jgi:hypothetical protein
LVGVIANVSVNGQVVGYLDNLYRNYYINLRADLLKQGENTLRIDIDSTVQYTFIHHANYTSIYGNVADSFDWNYVWLKP